ncbi:hypothetical protein K435DRAFT_960010 [Dendrothele bispora CBS 962.96]|uniref:Uncharacterized protein n=1 Tax=Dendrothele bispora (strain CBS 962.96) TaxID=1314807 RepID=A0A4S8MVW9_DENBC|nr:hypothetical protein K435DRAFT_960010 [Dendrothele bispora CBS 962.96]
MQSPTTPFLNLLRSFTYPDDDQIPQIRHLLSHHENSLRHLRPEILHVVHQNNNFEPFNHLGDSQLHTLLCMQKSIEESLATHLSLFSPMRKLPTELLAEIFILCLPDQFYVAPDPLQAPLLLASVCAGWRTITLSTSNLWSSLCLRPGITYQRANPLLSTWLSRTSSRPLSLSLHAELWRRKEIAELLNRSSPRWKHICVYDELPKHKHTIWNHVLNVPMLETFELISPSGVSQEQLDNFASVLNSSNRLTQFIWKNGQMSSAALDVVWSKLTHITLNVELPPSFCLDLLQNAHNLVQLIYHNIRIPSSPDRTLLVPVCLPHLETIAMTFSDNPCVLFDSITLPALKSLELMASCHNSPFWFRLPYSMRSLFERSRCPLETLDIHLLCFDEDEFIDFLLPVHTTLREITLEMNDKSESFSVGDKVLNLLSSTTNGDESAERVSSLNSSTIAKPSPCLCPRLQSIAVYSCISCTEGAFSSMVQTRLIDPNPDDPSYVARLRLVEIFDTDHERSYLERLRDQGLILQVYSYHTKDPLKMDDEDEIRLRRLFQDGVLPTPQEHTINAN